MTCDAWCTIGIALVGAVVSNVVSIASVPPCGRARSDGGATDLGTGVAECEPCCARAFCGAMCDGRDGLPEGVACAEGEDTPGRDGAPTGDVDAPAVVSRGGPDRGGGELEDPPTPACCGRSSRHDASPRGAGP